MGKIYEGNYSGKDVKIAIVISRFNEFITSKLLDGAKDCLYRHEVDEKDIDIFWTPGAFEIPLIAKEIARKKKHQAIICLGAIIRGNTPHFEYVANEVAKGIAQISLETGTPVMFGIITADNLEQAIERAGTKAGNKGWNAALSALEIVNLLKTLE